MRDTITLTFRVSNVNTILFPHLAYIGQAKNVGIESEAWSDTSLIFLLSSLFFFQNALASYDFSWAVKDSYSGNDYGHSEKREGSDTNGRYYVQLPDGRVQTVVYNVDPYSGYQVIGASETVS